MNKIFITMILGLGTLSAWALTELDYDSLHSIPVDQQNERMSQTMRLFTEMERRYLHARLNPGTGLGSSGSPVSASARPPQSWGNYAEQLVTAFSSSSATGCLYGGFFSQMITRDGQQVCAHPSQLDAESVLKKNYDQENHCSGVNASGQAQVACNPAIYGFKRMINRTKFCVSTESNRISDPSIECMKKAFGSEEVDADSKQDRLNFLRGQYRENPQLAESLFSIIKKTCVCPTLPSALYPQSRPTRSCASMMSLAAETELPVCQRVRPQVDLSIFQEFNKYGIQHVLAEDELNDLYNNRFLANGVNADQYRSLCNQAPSGARESHQCVPTCKAWPTGLVHCEYKVTHNITREELDFKYPYELQIARGQEVSLKLTNSQDQAICRIPTDIPITIDPDDLEDVKSSCSVSIKRTKNSVTVTPEFKMDPSETKGELNWSPEPTRMTGESAYYEVSENGVVGIIVELEVKRGNATTVIECGDIVHPEEEEDKDDENKDDENKDDENKDDENKDDENKDDDEDNDDESSLGQRLKAKGSSLLNRAKPRLRRAWDSTKRFSSNGFRRTREQYNQWRRQRAERQGNGGTGNSAGQPTPPPEQSPPTP